MPVFLVIPAAAPAVHFGGQAGAQGGAALGMAVGGPPGAAAGAIGGYIGGATLTAIALVVGGKAVADKINNQSQKSKRK